ncbi:GNAT family N-acetyltransferase [Desulfobulbus alkaliphilus]|uniref:GNAT family N-acetyltransferase n=1 Tax=Desulfobulbus alkaliphilus TaxID=869814 RepID=UPI001965233B|nr:GNAT family N-acetyltransferase [Desulfobulbus alkaliphilus]MBM9538450.1 GNAT family N-acetyltransferase [Desulfobulbus alkaliphilus]
MKEIIIIKSNDVLNCLSDPTFTENWEKLYISCPWATVYQSYSYAQVWYKSYLATHEPVLFVWLTNDKKIRGLLALARDKSNGNVGCVGMHHGEYQVWLAYPEDKETFITKTLMLFHKEFPGRKLQFMYIPPSTPLDWTAEKFFKKYCYVKDFRRPVIDLRDTATVRQFLNKKRNRARLNQIKRMGDLQVRSISDPESFKNRLPEIITLFDFRRMAAFGFTSFGSDRLKAPYHEALASVPDASILRALEMTVDNHLVAIVMTLVGKGQAHRFNGGIFSPLFSKQSPMGLVTYMLAEQLSQDGYHILDISPGGGDDSYKWSLANAEDTAHVLVVYPSSLQYHVSATARKIRLIPGKVLRKSGVNTGKLFACIAYIKARVFCPFFWVSLPWIFVCWIYDQIYFSDEIRVFYIPNSNTSKFKFKNKVSCNSLDDLLAFVPQKPWQSKQSFVAAAANALGKGNHVYTIVENGRLVAWVWLSSRKNQFVGYGKAAYDLKENSSLLYDLNVIVNANRENLILSLLQAALNDISFNKGVKRVYFIDNKYYVNMEILESLGLKNKGTFFYRRCFGWTSSRSEIDNFL